MVNTPQWPLVQFVKIKGMLGQPEVCWLCLLNRLCCSIWEIKIVWKNASKNVWDGRKGFIQKLIWPQELLVLPRWEKSRIILFLQSNLLKNGRPWVCGENDFPTEKFLKKYLPLMVTESSFKLLWCAIL